MDEVHCGADCLRLACLSTGFACTEEVYVHSKISYHYCQSNQIMHSLGTKLGIKIISDLVVTQSR